MSKLTILSGTTALVTLMTGSAAFADVTAQDVWGDWKSYMTGFGYQVTGTETTSAGTLTVSDLAMSMAMPEDGGNVSVTLQEMKFTENGDGSVSVGLPASMPVTIKVNPKGDVPAEIVLDYTNTGFNMVVSGDANDMTYTYSAPEVGMRLAKVMAEGNPVDIGTAAISVKDLSGHSKMKIGNLRELAQVMNAGAITYDFDIANPENPAEVMKIAGALNKLAFDGGGSYPLGEYDINNLDAMLKAGFAFNGAFSYEGGNSTFHVVDGSDTVDGSTQSAGGALEVAMSQDMLKYSGATQDVKINFQGGGLPFPVDLGMKEGAFRLIMPISKSDDLKDFALGVTLGGFSVSDMIWGMIDPGSQLPHDPATVAFDLSGKGKLGFDMMDPAQMEAMDRGEVENPGELKSLDLNNLEVTVAGASLTGKGGFTFDFPKVMESQGTQGTDGSVELNLTGANALMDKLVAMGLVPEDQVMGARMMMGMFAVPTGDDALTSKIEMKPDGQILANGQRLQ